MFWSTWLWIFPAFGEQENIFPLQLYADTGVFLGCFTMSNTLSDIYRVRTGTQGCAVNGQGQILGESHRLAVRDLQLAEPQLLAELAAAPSGRLLSAAEAPAPRECWECWVRVWQNRQPGSQLTGRLAGGQKDEGQERTSLPRLQQVPSLPRLVGVRLLRLYCCLLPPSKRDVS